MGYLLPENTNKYKKIIQRESQIKDTLNVHFFFFLKVERQLKLLLIDMRHLQLIQSKLGFYFSSGITLDIDVSFFGTLPIDQSKIKHTTRCMVI